MTMLQSIDNPQPMYIPTRISPDVVASSRQLIPLGTVEMGGKSYYRFELGSGFFSAIKFYEVDMIRSINQMSETEVDETEVVIEPAKVVAEPVSPTINIGVAEPEQTPAPVVEPEVESEPGAKIVSWYSDTPREKLRAEKEIAALEAKGWEFRGMTSAIADGIQVGEYSVLYVRPQAVVSS